MTAKWYHSASEWQHGQATSLAHWPRLDTENVFDVAKDTDGWVSAQGVAKVNIEGLVMSAVASRLPEIERLLQQYSRPVQVAAKPTAIPQRPVVAPTPVVPPMSNPQSLPIVDVTQLNTAKVATPLDIPRRNWNDSQVMPVVQAGQ